MTNQHEWTEGGKELLNEINIRIKSYGGQLEVLKSIEKENPLVTITNGKWKPYEVKILLDNMGMPQKVALLTGRSYNAVKGKQYQILYKIRRKQLLFS